MEARHEERERAVSTAIGECRQSHVERLHRCLRLALFHSVSDDERVHLIESLRDPPELEFVLFGRRLSGRLRSC